jgi:hypothetical protein
MAKRLEQSLVEEMLKAFPQLEENKNWVALQVLKILQNNVSWRAGTLAAINFGDQSFPIMRSSDEGGSISGVIGDFDGLDLVPIGRTEEEGDERRIHNWKALTDWLLKNVVDLQIHSTNVIYYGDEGGPQVLITFVDKDDFRHVTQGWVKADLIWEKAAEKASKGMFIEKAKNPKYLWAMAI